MSIDVVERIMNFSDADVRKAYRFCKMMHSRYPSLVHKKLFVHMTKHVLVGRDFHGARCYIDEHGRESLATGVDQNYLISVDNIISWVEQNTINFEFNVELLGNVYAANASVTRQMMEYCGYNFDDLYEHLVMDMKHSVSKLVMKELKFTMSV